MVFWNYNFHTVFHNAELSSNPLGDFVVFWNSDVHTVFHTAELSSTPLGILVFWNYDFQTGGSANAPPESQERSLLNCYQESRCLDERGSTCRDGRKTRSTILSDTAKALSDVKV